MRSMVRPLGYAALVVLGLLAGCERSLPPWELAGSSPAAAPLAPTELIPERHATSAPRNTDVAAALDEAIGAWDPVDFRIHAMSTGLKAGEVETPDPERIVFEPAEDFLPGEVVRATITGDLEAQGGGSMENGQVWEFRSAAAVGPATFTSDGVYLGTAGTNAHDIVAGDLNGDRLMDFVVGNMAEVNIVFVNNGNGSFASAAPLSPANNTRDLALGDLDNDGDLDLVAVNHLERNTTYAGDGSGNFITPGLDFGDQTSPSQAVAIGDVDGDGWLDVAVGNELAQNYVYINDGATGFGLDRRVVGIGNDDTRSICLADFDNDGDLDLAAGNYQQPNTITPNLGDGEFANGSTRSLGGDGKTRAVACADINDDGWVDLVVGNEDEQNVVYVNNKIDMGADVTIPFGSATDATVRLDVGDANGDGLLDIATADAGGKSAVYLNRSGSFPDVTGLEIGAAADGYGVAWGDVDGDGDLDVALARSIAQRSEVWLNGATEARITALNPANHAQDVSITTPLRATFNQAMVSGDVSSFPVRGFLSGRRGGTYSGGASTQLQFAPSEPLLSGEVIEATLTKELLSVSGPPLGHAQVWRFCTLAPSGPAVFDMEARSFGTGADGTRDVAAGDLDHDGFVDLVVANASGHASTVYFNDGSGSFLSGAPLGAATLNTQAVALGDVDTDGWLDIVLANGAGQANMLFKNPGGGGLAGVSFGGTADARAVALGDLNGDGHLDIAFGNLGSETVIYINSGSGSFGTAVAVGTTDDHTRAIALGDIDNDGDLDIVEGNDGQPIWVMTNNGKLTFSASTPSILLPDATQDLALADLDDDGYLDLVVANLGTANQLLFNDQSGAFEDRGVQIGSGSDPTVGVEVGDLDGDGALDVVLVNDGAPSSAWLNDGLSFTVERPLGVAQSSARGVAIANVDEDGDLDIALGNAGGQNTVALNSNATGNLPPQVHHASVDPAQVEPVGSYHVTVSCEFDDAETTNADDLRITLRARHSINASIVEICLSIIPDTTCNGSGASTLELLSSSPYSVAVDWDPEDSLAVGFYDLECVVTDGGGSGLSGSSPFSANPGELELLGCVPTGADTNCNGLDENCDGTPDEAFVGAITNCGTGVCFAEGVETCVGGLVEDSCTPGAPLGPEDPTCDNVDDNCMDGVDEDYQSQVTFCGFGACRNTGLSSCAGGVVASHCTPLNVAEADDPDCDGVDDDCDGDVDEDWAEDATCGQGYCHDTNTPSICLLGDFTACVPGEPLRPEDTTCDGVDDDCSGVADEDWQAGTCGLGVCESVQSCLGAGGVHCTVGLPTEPFDVICDGIDGDCDGDTDEDFIPEACGVGYCRDHATPSACANNVISDCVPAEPLRVDDPTCDGVDDNCNGETDEDAYKNASCGSDGGGVCVVATCSPISHACETSTISGCCESTDDCWIRSDCFQRSCVDNACVYEAVPDCCSYDEHCRDGDFCTRDTCDTSSGLCSREVIAHCCNSNADCADDDECTHDQCHQGRCLRRPVCASNNPCAERDDCVFSRVFLTRGPHSPGTVILEPRSERPILQIRVATTALPSRLESLRLAAALPLANTEHALLNLYADAEGNGVVDAEDELLATATVEGASQESVAFDEISWVVARARERDLLITATLRSGSAGAGITVLGGGLWLLVVLGLWMAGAGQQRRIQGRRWAVATLTLALLVVAPVACSYSPQLLAAVGKVSIERNLDFVVQTEPGGALEVVGAPIESGAIQIGR